MHAPEISSDNEILASLRKRTKEITEGIESEIDELHRLNPYKRSMEFLSFGILYVFGATLAYFSKGNIIITISGIICMGISLNSLCILIHEGLHGLLAERPWVNHLLSFIVGLPILISATAYQTTHANHHYEIGRKLDYGTYRQHLKSPTLIWLAYFTQLLLGSIVYIACIPFLAYKVANKRSRFFIVAEYCIIIPCAVTVCLIADPASILIYWAYPIVIMSFLTNIRGLASHALGDVENLYLSSRTIKSSKLVSFLFLHENYHLEHHIFPGAPSYSLRKIHELTWKRLPETLYAKSYRQFLIHFFQAALKRDLTPMGIVHPIKNLERTPAE